MTKKSKIIKRLDKKWSLCVRKRDKFICQKCKNGVENKHAHASHIFSRSHKSTRWDINNGITLCYYHHIRWAHRQPLEYTEWIKGVIGTKMYRKLNKKRMIEITLTVSFLEITEKKLDRYLTTVESD